MCMECKQMFSKGWDLYHHQRRGLCDVEEDPNPSRSSSSTELFGVEEVESGDDVGDEAVDDGDEGMGDPLEPASSASDDDDIEQDDEGHVCQEDCGCHQFEMDLWDGGGREDGHDRMLDFVEWGECEITESGKHVLRFLATVMKGQSMSQTKAEDCLR